jgi:lincosamide nucleotidyltransferase A/C/D/E
LDAPGKLASVVTEMTCEDVVEVLAALDAGGIDYWVDGGWGIDALVGEQTRIHHDLDLGVSLDDVARVEALLPQFRRESEEASYYKDERGRAVDLLLVERSQTGQLQQVAGGRRVRYAESETHASGYIGGRPVRCASVALQRERHDHPDATDQDRVDIEVLERERRTRARHS